MDVIFPKVYAGEQPSARRDNAIAEEVMRLSRALNGEEYINNGNGVFRVPNVSDKITVLNTTEEEIPAFAVMETMVGNSGTAIITDATNTQAIVRVRQTNSSGYGAQYGHLINGPQPIAPLRYSRVPRNQDYIWGLFNNDGYSPSLVGQVLGPYPGSWKLRVGIGGYVVVGNYVGDQNIVLLRPAPCLEFDGTTQASATIDNTVNVTAPGNVTVSCLCRYSGVSNSQQVRCAWRWDENTGATRWMVVDKKCSS